MPDEKILIDPDTGEEYVNVPVKTAAKYLDFPYTALYEALKQDLMPFGKAVCPTNGTKWSFLIPVARLKAYAEGKF